MGGLHDEFIFSGKIDNLSMTYCGLTGFLKSLEKGHDDSTVRVLALYDHEEIGSASLAGAESTSLRCIFNQLSGERLASQAIRKSFLLSYVIVYDCFMIYRMFLMLSILSILIRLKAIIVVS